MKQLGLMHQALLERRATRNFEFRAGIANAVFVGVPSIIIATPSVAGFEENHLPEINAILERFDLPQFEKTERGFYKAGETTIKLMSGALEDGARKLNQ